MSVSALARPAYYGIIMSMSEQDKMQPKSKMGRPATGKGVPIQVRLQPDMLDWLDSQRARLDPVPSRPEMIRQILERSTVFNRRGGSHD